MVVLRVLIVEKLIIIVKLCGNVVLFACGTGKLSVCVWLVGRSWMGEFWSTCKIPLYPSGANELRPKKNLSGLSTYVASLEWRWVINAVRYSINSSVKKMNLL